MKESIWMTRNQGMEFIFGQVETDMMEAIWMMNEMVLERWFGKKDLTRAYMLENGRKEYSMALERWHFLMVK